MGPWIPLSVGDGRVTTNFSGSPSAAFALILQPNGKLVAAGGFALARYNPNGTLDPSFSGDGKLTTDFGSANDSAVALVMQPTDGRLVVAVKDSGAGSDFVLARYHAIGCGTSVATQIGTAGNDILNGTPGPDVI